MDRKSWWKWPLLVVLVSASFMTVLPVKDKVRLGLDLKGGTSFTVQIDEQAVAGQLRDELKDMSEDQILSRVPAKVKEGISKEDAEKLKKEIEEAGGTVSIK